MRIADVERTDGGALVPVEWQLAQSGEVVSRLKTRRSRRVAGLPEPWAGMLFDAISRLPVGSVWTNDDGCGIPVRRWKVADECDDALRRAGVDHRPMQALRPTYETRMHWDGGMPIEKVATTMGHTGTRTALSSYDRPGVEAAKDAIKAGARIAGK